MKLKFPFARKKPREVPPPFESAKYWSDRYEEGRTSGSGSYGRLARYKADVINELAGSQNIGSVLELGSGDGNQASLFEFDRFTGVDVSRLVVDRANERFADRPGWQFIHSDAFIVEPRAFDMTMSLDVIYHLVEDDVFNRYMRDLVTLADRFVLIYASDHDEQAASPHVRHRSYSMWMAENAPEFTLTKTYEQPYPMVEGADVDQTSFAFFRLFERQGQSA